MLPMFCENIESSESFLNRQVIGQRWFPIRNSIDGTKRSGERNRRRFPEAAQLAAKYYERRLEGEVDDALVYRTCKKEYSEHAKQVAKREEELLSRTIFVTNVKDLRSHRNTGFA